MRKSGRIFKQMLAAVLGAAALAWSAGASLAAEQVAMREQAGIRYACGGVGDEEREALLAFRPQANMELLLVTEKRGGYLAGVPLTISRAGGAPLVQIADAGPICLVTAPPGAYRVEATYEGVTRSRTVNVASASGKAKPAVLAFPDDSFDGISATEDEKRGRAAQGR